MSDLMESRAETIKLARALYQEDDSLAFLENQPPEELRAFRESVTDSLFDEHRSGFAKLAKLSSLLPTGIAATLAQKALGATLAGRVTGEFSPAKAVAIARKLPSEFLARVTLNLEPRQAAPVVRAMPDDIVVAVTQELLAREEYISMARFIDVLSDDTVGHVMDEIEDDAAMLRIGFFAENKQRLDQVVRMLSEDRLRDSIEAAAEQDLWPEALGLASHVQPDLKGQMADIVLEQPRAVLDELVTVVHAQGLWAGLIPALSHISDNSLAKLFALDCLGEADTLKIILRTAEEQSLWPDLLPALCHLPAAQAETLVPAALSAPKKTIKSLLRAAGEDEPSRQALLDLTARLCADSQARLAETASDLLAAKDRKALLDATEAAQGLEPFRSALEQSA